MDGKTYSVNHSAMGKGESYANDDPSGFKEGMENYATVVTLPIGGPARGLATKGGASVLGHFPAYVAKAESLGARYFNVPSKVWNKMSPSQQWAANVKFLDRAIARGDTFYLATPAANARAGSWYARELKYLNSRGYTINSEGTQMLPPVP